jgi:hypothetical protein
MIRKLLCPKCGHNYTPYPEDEVWNFRLEPIRAKRPAGLAMQVISAAGVQRIDVPFLVCDHCNAKIQDGTPAVALTVWRDSEPAPESWAKEYSV